MIYVEAVNPVPLETGFPVVFLAGGVVGCRDWQKELKDELKHQSMVILNPRRKDFPIGNPSAAKRQITWEYHALRVAGIVSFWFSKETIQPIVMYELGATLMRAKHTGCPRVVVGVEEGYARAKDVEIQCDLVSPGLGSRAVEVIRTLSALASNIVRVK